MSQIMYTLNNPKGSVNYIAGVVTKIIENKDDRHPYVIAMTANVWAQDTGYVQKTVYLNTWANDKHNRLQKLQKMKIYVGAFIVAQCGNLKEYTTKNGENVLQGLLFQAYYNTKRDITDRNNSYVLLSGYANEINQNPDGSAKMVLGARVYNAETKQYVNTTFTCVIPAKLFVSVSSAGFGKSCRVCVLTETADSFGETVYLVKRIEFAPAVKKEKKN